jgi:hypothetical protein
MKRLLHLVVLLLISINLFAQAPQKMTYQAVIRNTSNNLVVNSPVKMKISILQGSTTGTAVYSEQHNPTTNANGLVSIEIGEGTSKTGTFSTIDWGNGMYFLKTETDPTNGNNLSIVGTSQLLSVPYALQANNAGNGIKQVSNTGDTVYLDNGKKYIIPGIKDLNPTSTINNGLVAFYPFNGNTNDESGNNNNGTVNGGVSFTNDRNANQLKSCNFNGNGFIEIPSLNNLQYKPITYSVWIKPSSLVTENLPLGNAVAIMGRDLCGQGIQGQLGVWNDPNKGFNQLMHFYTGGAGQIFNHSPTLNSWTHIVFIWDASEIMRLYVNGNLIQSQFYSSAGFTPNGIIPFRIGAGAGNCTNNTIGRYFWKGDIDEIRIYNRALTQEEITYLANN